MAEPSVPASVPALTRRFHIGDLLAAVMKTPAASPGGIIGLMVLQCYMAGQPPVPHAGLSDFLHEARADADDFAAAVVAAYPELGAFLGHAPPPAELLGPWLRRREREFGRYHPAPLLPATHPLRRHALRAGPDRPDVPRSAAPLVAAPPPVPGGLSATCARYAGGMRRPPAPPALREVGEVGGAPGRGPRRRFHVGDLLSVVMDCIVAPRGLPGAIALLRYMAGESAADPDVLSAYLDDFRAAVLGAHPALGAYGAADEPPAELLDLWLRRREREFGRYLVAPLLPAGHPLRAPAPSEARSAPTPLADTTADATRADRTSRRSGLARAPAPA